MVIVNCQTDLPPIFLHVIWESNRQNLIYQIFWESNSQYQIYQIFDQRTAILLAATRSMIPKTDLALNWLGLQTIHNQFHHHPPPHQNHFNHHHQNHHHHHRCDHRHHHPYLIYIWKTYSSVKWVYKNCWLCGNLYCIQRQRSRRPSSSSGSET